MAYCSKCGKEIDEEAEICVHCGVRVNKEPLLKSNDGKNTVRFFLTLLFGFFGSFIINHTNLKPNGWKSRTCAYFFWGWITCGIYSLIASFCNFSFNAKQSSNIGYFKD